MIRTKLSGRAFGETRKISDLPSGLLSERRRSAVLV
jgi:hypothetical protein